MGKQRQLPVTTKPVALTALPLHSSRHQLIQHRFTLLSGASLAIIFALVLAAHANGVDQKADETVNHQQAAATRVSASVSNQSNLQQTSAGQTSHNTKVTVNGQSVAVPANGSVHQTISTPGGGSTSVDVSSNQTSTSQSLNTSVSQTLINNSNNTLQSTSLIQQQSEAGP